MNSVYYFFCKISRGNGQLKTSAHMELVETTKIYIWFPLE